MTGEIVPKARGLRLTRVNHLWVADITYIRLQKAFVYQAVVIDSFSRWAVADHLRASLPIDALTMALEERRPPGAA